MSDEETDNLRLYEVHGNKIYKELRYEDSVAAFNEYVTIYAEQIPKEEHEADETVDRAVYAFHFDKEASRSHGIPFKFVVKPGEVFSETKTRLSARTGFKDKALERIKFAVVPKGTFSRPIYLKDEDVLADMLTSSEDLLGLDHMNKTRARGQDVMMIR